MISARGPTPRRQTSLASMSGHPCFASLARLPDRSTPCRPASAEASKRAVGTASNAFPLGLAPFHGGTCIGTTPSAHDLSALGGRALRTHGGITESHVPFIPNYRLNDTYAERAARGGLRLPHLRLCHQSRRDLRRLPPD